MTIAKRIEQLKEIRYLPNIDNNSAEWGYENALDDILELFRDELSDEAKQNPSVRRLYQMIYDIKDQE